MPTVVDSHIGGTDTPDYDEGRTDGTTAAAAAMGTRRD